MIIIVLIAMDASQVAGVYKMPLHVKIFIYIFFIAVSVHSFILYISVNKADLYYYSFLFLIKSIPHNLQFAIFKMKNIDIDKLPIKNR
jgi:hypothetical protein